MRDWSFVMHLARRYGKTTAMAEACRKIGAALVCPNARMAQQVAKDHGVSTISVDAAERWRGRTGPVLFEPEAVALLSSDYEAEIRKLRDENERLRKKVYDLWRYYVDEDFHQS